MQVKRPVSFAKKKLKSAILLLLSLLPDVSLIQLHFSWQTHVVLLTCLN